MNRLSFLLAAITFAASAAAAPAAAASESHLTGTIVSVRGNVMLLQTRSGKNVIVDLTQARSNERVGVLVARVAVVVYGKMLPDGTFQCTHTGHAAPNATSWESDR
jgi:hypothetical protein